MHVLVCVATGVVTPGRVTRLSGIHEYLFSGEPGFCSHAPTQSRYQNAAGRRGASTGRITRGGRWVVVNQALSRFPAIEMKAVKFLARRTAHQTCVFVRQLFGYIQPQSSPRRNLRLFLETPTRRHGVDAHRRCLKESRDQRIPKCTHDHPGDIFVSDGV